MLPRALNDIDGEYLRTLPQHGPSESKRIEYKSRFRDKGDNSKGIDRDTFRKDVTQFANSEGGDLIVGVDETDGAPTMVPGVKIESGTPQSTKETLDQLLLDVQPRLTGHQIGFWQIAPNRFVFIIRIPQSFRAPHCIGNGKGFFYRTNSGRDPMNIDQIRNAFLSSESIETRLRQFRDAQLAAAMNRPRHPLEAGLVAVLHLLPAIGVAQKVVVDVVGDRNTLLAGGLAGRRIHSSGVNFDGCYCKVGYGDQPTSGYVQWFRNSYRESLRVYPPPHRQTGDRDAPILDEITLARNIVTDLEQTIQVLQTVRVPPPYFAAVTLLKCQGYQLGYYDDRYGMFHARNGSSATALTRMDLLEVLIESDNANLATALRPTFDQLANAFGFERSFNYFPDGVWIHNRS